jgi:hypothetical protein
MQSQSPLKGTEGTPSVYDSPAIRNCAPSPQERPGPQQHTPHSGPGYFPHGTQKEEFSTPRQRAVNGSSRVQKVGNLILRSLGVLHSSISNTANDTEPPDLLLPIRIQAFNSSSKPRHVQNVHQPNRHTVQRSPVPPSQRPPTYIRTLSPIHTRLPKLRPTPPRLPLFRL